jgi:hypothetical protein
MAEDGLRSTVLFRVLVGCGSSDGRAVAGLIARFCIFSLPVLAGAAGGGLLAASGGLIHLGDLAVIP